VDKLRVRVYNVRFGDAILITVPDRSPRGKTTLRHILIDVGNSLNKAGGINEVFQPVVEDILRELGGKGVDLYIMTHEHMDHVKGLPYADQQFYGNQLKEKLGVKYAWLTASSAPDYYDAHPKAKEKRLQMLEAYQAITSYLAASPDEPPLPVQTLLEINNLAGTDDCVEFLRGLAPAKRTFYIYRGASLARKHNFSEAKFEIWAPEEDTSAYYGRFQPSALNFIPAAGGQGEQAGPAASAASPLPPQGVDASAFYNLVDRRRRGVVENLMGIDQAANNTSVVFTLKWRGYTLLFAADAELRSWQTMQREGVLQPVDFLKVGHHGSHNATPPPEILAQILPPTSPRPRRAAVSTYNFNHYSGVPDPDTLDRIKETCTLSSTMDLADGKFFDIEFEPRSA
jgi:beta-lactamase superfamily II metal-dependent hydrolase